jgi:hypothetical protein
VIVGHACWRGTARVPFQPPQTPTNTMMHNLTMDNVIAQINKLNVPKNAITALENYARDRIQKSVVLASLAATQMSVDEHTGVERWIALIDDTRVDGVVPTPAEEVSSQRAQAQQPRARDRLRSAPPAGSRRNSVNSRQRSPDVIINLPPAGSPKTGSGNGSTDGGRSSSNSTEAKAPTSPRSQTFSPSQGEEEDEHAAATRKAGRKAKERKARKEAKKARAAAKEAEKVARKKERKRKIAERKVRRGKTSRKRNKRHRAVDSDDISDSSLESGGSDTDSSSSTSASEYASSTSSSSADSMLVVRSRNDRRTMKLPFKFKAGKVRRKWANFSSEKRAKMLIKWREAMNSPKCWFAMYGGKIVLNRLVSKAHAWKLIQTWSTELAILGCNMQITNIQSKSAKDLEEALGSEARRRNDYYSWRAALEAAMETWDLQMPWLRKQIERYGSQMLDLWETLLAQFTPKLHTALLRLQAAHRWIMFELDRDPYKLIGDRKLFKLAEKRYTSSGYNAASETVFVPGKWLEEPTIGGADARVPRSMGMPIRGAGQSTPGEQGRQPVATSHEFCMEYNHSLNGCIRPGCKYIHNTCACERDRPHGCGTAGPFRLCALRGQELRRPPVRGGGRGGANGNGRAPIPNGNNAPTGAPVV